MILTDEKGNKYEYAGEHLEMNRTKGDSKYFIVKPIKKEPTTFEEVFDDWRKERDDLMSINSFNINKYNIEGGDVYKTMHSMKALAILAEVLNDGEEGEYYLSYCDKTKMWDSFRFREKIAQPQFKDKSTALKAGKIIERDLPDVWECLYKGK